MKTILILIVFAAVCFTAKAEKNRFQYVITDNDTLICKNIRIGHVNTKCVMRSGEKKTIPNDNINVIGKSAVKGKVAAYRMEKKPVYLNNEFTGKHALMELVDVQNGVRIYKYFYFNSDAESVDLVVSFYKGNKLINTKINPNVRQVNDFAYQYTCKSENKKFFTSK